MKPAEVHIRIGRLTCHAADAATAARLPRPDAQRLGAGIAAQIDGSIGAAPHDPLSAAIARALQGALAAHLGEPGARR